jgi:uncharacterized membrane protein (DUF373 family)
MTGTPAAATLTEQIVLMRQVVEMAAPVLLRKVIVALPEIAKVALVY